MKHLVAGIEDVTLTIEKLEYDLGVGEKLRYEALKDGGSFAMEVIRVLDVQLPRIREDLSINKFALRHLKAELARYESENKNG